jgi:hypothetical protein
MSMPMLMQVAEPVQMHWQMQVQALVQVLVLVLEAAPSHPSRSLRRAAVSAEAGPAGSARRRPQVHLPRS